MINKKINKNEMISSNINSILSIIQMGSVYSILTLYVIKKSYSQILVPFNKITPIVGLYKRKSNLIIVLLPAPFFPKD